MKMHRWFSLLLLVVLLSSMLAACGGGEEPTAEPTQAAAAEPTQAPAEPTAAPAKPTDAPASEAAPTEAPAAEAKDTWLIMMYQDGDDQVLEKDVFVDMNEAEMAERSDKVTIVAQMDRFKGSYDGGGDWTSTKRFLINSQDAELETLNAQELEDLGEINMGDPKTLVDFATWAIAKYPADHYVLILSDHGSGWPGGWSDNDPVQGGELKMNQIDDALAEILEKSQIGRFELVGFDACLMAQIEALSAVAPYARYAIASEETEPALGWAYSSFLTELARNPAMTGAELGKAIVDSYIDKDGRITNEEARKVLVSELFNVKSGEVTEAQVAEALGTDITLTAVDLSQMVAVNEALNNLTVKMSAIDQKIVAEARSYSQSYTNIFGEKKDPPAYIDLGHFAAILAESSGDADVKAASEALLAALSKAVVAEKHGPNRPGSTGMSIYFPISQLFKLTATHPTIKYTDRASRFVTASLWDDFLTFHYTKRKFDPAVADLTVLESKTPDENLSQAEAASAIAEDTQIEAPGAGKIEISGLGASAEEMKAGETVTIKGKVKGDNIGYIYLYTIYYDQESDSFVTTDFSYLLSEESKAVGGVTYPNWGDTGEVDIEFEWQPTIYYLNDGKNRQFAVFESEIYGRTEKENSYIVWGTYKEAGSEEGRDAFIRFDGEGNFAGLLVFSGEEAKTPREVTMKKGDTFTITEEWLEYDKNPDGEFKYYDGGVLTYGDQPFTMEWDEKPIPGQYVLGVIVEDLDGNSTEEFINIGITE